VTPHFDGEVRSKRLCMDSVPKLPFWEGKNAVCRGHGEMLATAKSTTVRENDTSGIISRLLLARPILHLGGRSFALRLSDLQDTWVRRGHGAYCCMLVLSAT
jgi:hypothetical protein